jgi:hypothetical protein
VAGLLKAMKALKESLENMHRYPDRFWI